MIDKCRDLCRKYTDLDEEQIAAIVTYLEKIQDIADKEECNVYIDCLTYNPKAAIIVGEAYGCNVNSIYQKPLLGMVIKIYNEPAVERGFQLGVPTIGVMAIEVPSANKVIQSVFPIVHKSKVIATLIYERELEDYSHRSPRQNKDRIIDSSAEWILTHISEAVFVVDEADKICYCNSEAEQLFMLLGYADSILGMQCENVIAAAAGDRYQFSMSGHILEVSKFKLDQRSNKICVIIKDLTGYSQLEKDNQRLVTEYRELVHSMKNGLFLLKNVCDRKEGEAEIEQVGQVCRDLSNRVMSLVMTMELKLKSGQKDIDIKQILKELGERLINLEAVVGKEIRLIVDGDEMFLNSEAANAVVLVVYELLCNALKYGLQDRKEGCIRIRVKNEDFDSWITVSDDGCGFCTDELEWGSGGLELVRSIIKERLNGKMVIASSPKGTSVSFDIG